MPRSTRNQFASALFHPLADGAGQYVNNH